MSHPVTARVFGGGVMGGMELGQEAVGGEPTDWRKVAISTGFGVVFNRPTRIGETITEWGARPARRAMGIAPSPAGEAASGEPVASPAPPAEPEAAPAGAAAPTGIAPTLFHATTAPTVADGADLAVMGPGISEQVFMGSHQPDSSATEVARETKRTEQPVIGPPPAEDVHSVARQMHFDLFATYDELRARRRALEAEPGAAAPLAATEAELARIEPEVQAAYRRAADAVGAEIHEGSSEASSTPSASERTIEDQRDYIVQDVKRQLKAAGRPDEETQAVAQLVAARYEARAARMNGALGTAEELYDREAAEIRGQQIRAKVQSPGGRAALAGFQERMAQGKDAAKRRRDEGGSSPYRTYKTAEERHGHMSEEDLKAARDAYEDSVEGLEPEERAGAREEFTRDDAEELFQAALGKINLNPKGISGKDFTGAEGVRPILTVMKNANASTAVHELGHEWLAQMLRDAEHEKAPADVRADRDALLKWFGVDSVDGVATRHHEKFARGFEQYLRDGVAPSARLAELCGRLGDEVDQAAW